MSRRRREPVENEEQYEMKPIVVEEQEEEEEEEGSEGERETGFVDLDQDTLLNVLERVDAVTLGRAECVNKLWRKVARDDWLWERIAFRLCARCGWLESLADTRRCLRSYGMTFRPAVRFWIRLYLGKSIFNKPSDFNSIPDFYSIDPQVFSSQMEPWVQN